MKDECLFHPEEIDGECPYCDEDISNALSVMDDNDSRKWASLVGFLLDQKDRGNLNLKLKISKGSRDVVVIDETFEIEIS